MKIKQTGAMLAVSVNCFPLQSLYNSVPALTGSCDVSVLCLHTFISHSEISPRPEAALGSGMLFLEGVFLLKAGVALQPERASFLC